MAVPATSAVKSKVVEGWQVGARGARRPYRSFGVAATRRVPPVSVTAAAYGARPPRAIMMRHSRRQYVGGDAGGGAAGNVSAGCLCA